MHWDVLRLFQELKKGLSLAARQTNRQLAGIGSESWGVDFALIGKDNTLLGYPCHYRDKRTEGMMEEAFRRVSKEEIFRRTGIQFMRINTLYQLLSLVISRSPLLEMAESLLPIADLFHFFFSGEKRSEFTLATTSQLYDPREGNWSRVLLDKLGIPLRIMPEVISPGTVLGDLLPEIAEEVGLKKLKVIAPACHDTASAVAAVPVQEKNWAYLSSGTWSFLGLELPSPIINDKVLEYNLSNEGGVGNTFRFLKNIMGLWLLQQCRRTWEEKGKSLSYTELTEIAQRSKPFQAFIDPDEEVFLNPPDMPGEIREFCRKTGQSAPQDQASIIRTILESLALKYNMVLRQLEEISWRKVDRLHIIGGGVQNCLLCQFTANAAAIPVVAGPVEATATGNILLQALALGDISSLEEGRKIVRASFPLVTYEPEDTNLWEEAYQRFLKVLDRKSQ